MGRSTVHYADNKTNNALKKLHNKLRPAGTPAQRVEYIIELLLLKIFETKIKQDDEFKPLRKLFSKDNIWKNPKTGVEETNENRLFSYLPTVSNEQILSELNDNFFPFYSSIQHIARQVFEGNLPQKVQDQLVLIEEVFNNSNFTNNVNTGNLGEVISIVANDIEELRLLKTDLLGDVPIDFIAEHKEIYVIKEVLKSGAKYPMVKLKDYLILNEHKVKPSQNSDVNYEVLGVSNEVGIFLNEKLQAEETNQSYFVVAKNEFCCNPYRINVGSIGLNTNDYDNQIISGAYIVFACKEDELNPKYLDALFKSKGFLGYVNDKANGGVRINFKFEDMKSWEIPLPSINEQKAIVAQIEKQKAIIEGAEKVLKNWGIDETVFTNLPFSELDKHLLFVSSCATPLGGSNVYIDANGVLDFSDAVLISKEVHAKMKRTQVKKSDVFLNITGASTGRSAVMYEDLEANVNQHVAILRTNKTLLPEYLSSVLDTPNLQSQIDKLQIGSSRQGLNFDQIRKLKIPITDIDSQRQIILELNSQLQILNGISKMKVDAEKKINKILADVWGIETVEPVAMEAEEVG
ncbi:restriction endonuclease subunit S [Mucilaginibacter arboris]|uniref:Type I restriction modification DNA specificity domain-containing protein n=1 Tax=Mucilaginibacter arboris TaxID=2682090 RepID=A0A7K1SXI7_9SPHI|nr:restriction endonuclease subunit S [Mucilaginibacter arboris]MVN21740.1 hypothetical protein [Mucilaginibacter arboris]